MSDYAFVRRPRWLVGHVLVGVMVSLFALAGVWQLNRLHERRHKNAETAHAIQANAVALGPRTAIRDVPIHVKATGRYDVAHEVILRNKTFEDAPGNITVTPLIGKGFAVLVSRGWVPIGYDKAPVAAAAPPTGRVTIDGLLLPDEPKRILAPDDPAIGTLNAVGRINAPRLQKQIPYPILDGYVLLAKQMPAQKRPLPRIVPPPPLDDGPHLGYAVQWFLFLATALVVYGALLRREAKRQGAAVGGPSAPLS